MAGLILCRDCAVKHPYYVTELQLHLYTGEELSYYIHNYVTLIREDFLNERLYQFLNELGYVKLEQKLRSYENRASLHEKLVLILQEILYYSNSELFAFKRQLDRMAELPEAEQRKARGDGLFQFGHYHQALREYDDILASGGDFSPSGDFAGRVWHNRGSAYARLENYTAAMECYLKAYACLGETSILEELFALCRLCPGLVLPPEIKQVMTPSLQAAYEQRFASRQQQAIFEGKALEAQALQDKPGAAKAEAYREMLEAWKTEYRTMA